MDVTECRWKTFGVTIDFTVLELVMQMGMGRI
jgi:hypothetical protein